MCEEHQCATSSKFWLLLHLLRWAVRIPSNARRNRLMCAP